MMKRTGNVQTEKTATGIITTVEEKGHIKGQKRTRWVQVGYTSIIIKEDENGRTKQVKNGP